MIKAVGINGKPDSERRTCYDCDFYQGALSWWCTSEDAIKERGTQVGGRTNCKQWKPIRIYDELSFFEKKFGNYIKIDLSESID